MEGNEQQEEITRLRRKVKNLRLDIRIMKDYIDALEAAGKNKLCTCFECVNAERDFARREES